MQQGSGRLPLGLTGAELASALLDCLDAESSDAQQALAEAVESWTLSEMRRRGDRPSEASLKQARLAAMNQRAKTAGGEQASRARNLINHRRKVVRGVLRAIEAPALRTSSRPSSSRPMTNQPQELVGQLAEHAAFLRSQVITDPYQLGLWAAQCFEQYDQVQRAHQSWSSALANNHRAEWLTFLKYLEPAMWLSDRDEGWLEGRDSFDQRLQRALEQLHLQSLKPQQDVEEDALLEELQVDLQALEVEPTPQRTSAPRAVQQAAPARMPRGYSSAYGTPTVAADTQALAAMAPPVAAEAPAPAPVPTAPAAASIEINRSGQGITLFIDADAYGVRDLEETAFTLSLMLLKPTDPTEVRVRAIPGPPRQIEMALGTLDVAKAQAARTRLLELLGAKRGG